MVDMNASTINLNIILLLLLMASPATPANLPVHQDHTRNIWTRAAKQGTCDAGYVWSVVASATSELGATCCPQGYKAETSIVSGLELSTFFCCPVADSEIPCDPTHEMLPGLPLTCPTPGTMVGVLCQGL